MASTNRGQILKWLKTSDPENNHGLARVYHEPNTGDWILQDERFGQWKAAGGNQLLWIYGIPGAGKTILCSSIIDHVQKHCARPGPGDAASKPTRAVYFYFDFSDRNKQSLRALLESVALQLVSDGEGMSLLRILSLYVSETATSLFESKNQGRLAPSPEELLDLIIAEVLRTEVTFLVIDALDECPEPERRVLFDQLLARMLQANIRILITSRKVPDIEHAISSVDSHSICIQDSIVDTDIRTHISSHIAQDDDFASWDSDLKTDVVDAIVAGAKGMFRWAICQIDSMKDCKDATAVRDRLKTMPASLDEMYDRILDAVPARRQPVLKSALQWLAFSNRPLLLEELATAVAVQPSLQEHTPPRETGPLPDDEHTIKELCGVLVKQSTLTKATGTPKWVIAMAEVESRGRNKWWPEDRTELTKVALSHYSVKEYLVSDRFRKGRMSRFAASAPEAHAFLAQSCLQYLLDFNHGSMAATLDYLNNPLLGYAARYWISHYELAGGQDNVSSMRPFVERLFSPKSLGSYINWLNAWNIERTWFPEARSLGHYMGDTKRSADLLPQPLYWAAALGDMVLVKSLMEKGANPNRTEGAFGSALGIAAFRGHVEVVEFFLSRGLDPDLKSAEFGTVLQIAALGGSELVVKRLIEAGADVNARGGQYETALLAAASKQHDKVVSLLAESGADLDYGDSKVSSCSKGSALYQAAAAGDMNLTNMLLAAGADVNGPEAAATGTPLLGATKAKSLGIVQLLIRKGADVNLGTDEAGYPLIEAARWRGQETTRKINLVLLQAGADPNVKEKYGTTALHKCIGYNPDMIVFQALLDAGADVNAYSSLQGTCWENAVKYKAIDVAKALRERGAKISAESVIPAASCYHEAPWILEAVLDTNPDVNLYSSDRGKATALHAALESAYAEGDQARTATSVLLARGAYVNAIDRQGNTTPLHLAIRDGLVDLAKELIDRGADIHRTLTSSPFEMAILFACKKGGTLQLADMLLGLGVDISRNNEDAPYIALLLSRFDVFEYLVKNGLDVNRDMSTRARPRATRCFDGTPVQYAAQKADIPMIKKLLALGAKLDPTSGAKGHTLYHAVMSEKASVVEFLLEMGAKVGDGPKGESILVKAIKTGLHGLVGRLVDLGADVNATDLGESPLSAALRADKKDLVDILRNRGARLSDTDREVAKVAIEKGDLEELRTLLDYGLNPNACKIRRVSKNESLYRPIQHASNQTDTAALQLLLDYGADLSRDTFAGVLSGVCHRGDVGMATFLLDHGAAVHVDKALDVAIGVKGNMAVVEMLFSRGAKVRMNTLGLAVQKGDTTMLARLLAEEMEPADRRDWLGRMLQTAASGEGHLELCAWLLDVHGADVNHSGEPHGSPLRAALSNRTGNPGREPLVDLLLAHGAEVNPPPPRAGGKGTSTAKREQRSSANDNAAIARKLLDRGADPNACGGGLHTPLQMAIACCPAMVAPLLDAGADIHAAGGRLGTALHVAAWKKDIDTIRLLLARGADARSVAGRYGTVLQAAALQKSGQAWLGGDSVFGDGSRQAEIFEVMDVLLAAGADPHVVDAGKYGSAAQTAAVKGNVAALQWLRDVAGVDVRAQRGGGQFGNAYRAAHKDIWRRARTAQWHVVSWLERCYGREGWGFVDCGRGDEAFRPPAEEEEGVRRWAAAAPSG
ncbi:hypothetical protein PG999_002967 [Apiospora kogelbergensis]|uniref:NACHT domain-containing protein n=1 Tax=Apiospora kogelbergensis TaxID=1337665 RepID=A0AAW0R9N9_9PEZI